MISTEEHRSVISREFTCAGQTRRFQFFDTEIGRAVSAQVLAGQSYPPVSFLQRIRTILDVGANTGAASVYFACMYPQATVIAFEPDPDCYRLLRLNTADLPQVSAHNWALSDHNGTADLFLGAQDPATNSLGTSCLNSSRSIRVEVRDAGGVLDGLSCPSVDILKLDTEGSEAAILRSLKERIRAVRAIYLEFHDEAARREIDSLFAPSHSLVHGTIHSSHRGELIYVSRAELPAGVDSLRIAQQSSSLSR